ncbi:MAG: hypothetical protein RL021_2139 [Bacteroidota bacterium]|jgi:hypothetical protein
MNKTLLFFAAIFCFVSVTAQVPSYRTLPNVGLAMGISPSGTFITGYGGAGGCFIYKTADSSVTSIGGVEAYGITDLGVVGGINNATGTSTPFTVAAIYNSSTGWFNLPSVPGGGYVTGTGSYSHAFGISDNGETVCGMYWANAGKTTAFVYNTSTGYTNLQDAGSSARANCISGDGLVTGGWWQGASRVPICWYPGPTGSTVGSFGEMFGTNSTGTYVAGYDNSGLYTVPILWDRVAGTSIPVPLPSGSNEGQAMAVADNGVTVGYISSGFSSSFGFIYIPGLGTFDLQAYLISQGATGVGNCGRPIGISRNGRYICGLTSSFPRSSWFIDLGSVPTQLSELNATATALTAYPNPVIGEQVSFSYESIKSTEAKVTVYDLQGRVVRVLSPLQLSSGNNNFSWDCVAENGVRVPSGSYIVTVEADGDRSRTTVVIR